jgi:hypothetical protein
VAEGCGVKRTDRRRAGAPMPSKWRVVAWWPGQAGFDITLEALDAKHARRLAEDAARGCGWTVSRPRKIQIVRVNNKRRAET